MHQERWEDIKNKIKKNFEVLNQSQEKNQERHQETELIEFQGPLGKMKVEWITRPKVLDKKTTYSRRIGGNVNVDYVYSEDEVTHTFKVYKWNEATDNWQEIKADNFI